LKWGWLVLKLVLIVICALGGYLIGDQLVATTTFWHYDWARWAGVLAGIMFAFATLSVEKLIQHIPLKVLAGGTIGLVLGLSVAKLIGFAFATVQNTTISVVIYVILSCIFGYIGIVLGTFKIEELRVPSWSLE
jgi:uncharacterized protein YacL